MDLALDFYRNRINEANELGSETKKWGDMKLTELEKDQDGHKVSRVTDIPDVSKHQARMYGDCQGCSPRKGYGRARSHWNVPSELCQTSRLLWRRLHYGDGHGTS